MSKPNFKTDLARGHAGELMLLKLWPDLERLDGRKSDFRVKSTGELLELKTDSYDMNKTANFFMERYSDIDRLKDGGPWSALNNKSDLFVYMFPANKTMHIFNTEKLVQELDKMLTAGKHTPIMIENARWTTLGYKIARSSLTHLFELRRF